MRALAAEHPEFPHYRRDLAVGHYRVGNLLTGAGRPAEALGELGPARDLLGDLARAGPDVPDYRNQLAFALCLEGDALRDLGRAAEARERAERAVALAEDLARDLPKVPMYRSRLADGLRRLAHLKLDAGDGAGADADARRAVALFEGLPTRDGREASWLACARATLATVARGGDAGPPSAEAAPLADRALDDLRRAAELGLRAPQWYRHEPALGPLREREDFKALMAELEKSAAP
jgi:hypothetical protein